MGWFVGAQPWVGWAWVGAYPVVPTATGVVYTIPSLVRSCLG